MLILFLYQFLFQHQYSTSHRGIARGPRVSLALYGGGQIQKAFWDNTYTDVWQHVPRVNSAIEAKDAAHSPLAWTSSGLLNTRAYLLRGEARHRVYSLAGQPHTDKIKLDTPSHQSHHRGRERYIKFKREQQQTHLDRRCLLENVLLSEALMRVQQERERTTSGWTTHITVIVFICCLWRSSIDALDLRLLLLSRRPFSTSSCSGIVPKNLRQCASQRNHKLNPSVTTRTFLANRLPSLCARSLVGGVRLIGCAKRNADKNRTPQPSPKNKNYQH